MSKITKLGMGIVAFDDTCHLRNILTEIRESCDEIVVCLQKTSYHGDPIETESVDNVMRLMNMGLVDDVIWFDNIKPYPANDPKTPRRIETDKRNFMLDYLEREKGCSHSMIIDSDEFYDGEDFRRAKEIIDNAPDMHVTYCQYVNYYRDYVHVLVWPFEAFVPFITEAHFRFDMEKGSFGKPSDPTRRYLMDPGFQYHILNFDRVKMHHLSWIRTNIADKVNSWSAKKYFDMDSLTKRILDRYENYKDGQNAVIMFNAPDNEVVVNKLPFQYIKPKYPIDEKLPEL